MNITILDFWDSCHCGPTRSIYDEICSTITEKIKCSLVNILKDTDLDAEEIRTAGYIVLFSPCVGTVERFDYATKILEKVLRFAQRSQKIFVYGCVARNHVVTSKKIEYFDYGDYLKLVKRINELVPQENQVSECWIPYAYIKEDVLYINLCTGCSNDCLFCKYHYLDNTVKSLPFKTLQAILESIKNNKMRVQLGGANLCLYSDDGKNFIDVLKLVQSYKNIEGVKLSGVAFRNLNDGIVDAINDYKAIDAMDHSLESGSDLTLKLMNKGVNVKQCLDYWERLTRGEHDIERGIIVMVNYCSPKNGDFDPYDVVKTAEVLNTMPADTTWVTIVDYIPQSTFVLPSWLCRFNALCLASLLKKELSIKGGLFTNPISEHVVMKNSNTLTTKCGDLELKYCFEKGHLQKIIAKTTGWKMAVSRRGSSFIIPPQNKYEKKCMDALANDLRRIYLKVKKSAIRNPDALKIYIKYIQS